MGLWEIILTTVPPNIGMGIENIFLLLLISGSIIFMAYDFKVGMIILLLFSTIVTMVFYNFSLNYTPFLIVMVMSIIILVLTLLFAAKAQSSQQVF